MSTTRADLRRTSPEELRKATCCSNDENVWDVACAVILGVVVVVAVVVIVSASAVYFMAMGV